MAQYIVSSGVTSTGAVLVNNSMYVEGGGVAAYTAVNSHGVLYVSSGGMVTDTAVNGGGSMYVSSGGTANQTTVSSGGFMSAAGMIAGNHSAYQGGAIANFDTVNISGGTFSANSAGSAGGAIYNGGTATLSGGTFSANSAGSAGGAIYNVGTAMLSGGTFSANYAGNYGGAIFNAGTAMLSGGTFFENSAYQGGAIYNDYRGTVYISGGTFSANSAYHGGAIFNAGRGSMYVSSGGTFSANSASYGGAIYNEYGTVYISGGTFSANYAGDSGGAIYNYRTVNVSGCTFSANSAGSAGGAIYNGGTLRLTGAVTLATQSDTIVNNGTLNWDLTAGNRLNSDFSISNWANVSGTGTYTVTVTETQAPAAYILAGNALTFNKSITVKNAAGSTLGTLSVGETKEFYDNEYTLDKAGGTLTLTIAVRPENVNLYASGVLTRTAPVMTGETLAEGGNDTMFVLSGGTANSTMVSSGGSMYVSSGGTANRTSIFSSGSMEVHSDGMVNQTTVENYGEMYVSSGGVAAETTLQNDGFMFVSDGAATRDTTVNTGGCLEIWGGTATGIVENGGFVNIAEDAAATFTPHSFSSMTVEFATLHSGTTATDLIVSRYVDDDGIYDYEYYEYDDYYYDDYDNRAAHLTIYQGGFASRVTILPETRMRVYSGGSATDILVSITGDSGRPGLGVAGRVSRVEVNSAAMTVSSGGYAENVSAYNYGKVYVKEGGVAEDVFLAPGRYICFEEMKYYPSGQLIVSSGGSASIAFTPWKMTTGEFSDDNLSIVLEDGAIVTYRERDYNVYFQGAPEEVYAPAYGRYTLLSCFRENFISELAVSSGCSAWVYDGGVIEDVKLGRGGVMEVHSGAVLNGFTAQNDFTAKDALTISGAVVSGQAQLTRDLEVAGVTVTSGGRMTVGEFAHGSDVTVAQDGNAFVLGGGTLENVTVTGGRVFVATGGEVKGDVSVSAGGGLYLYGGSILDGEIHVQGTLYVDETMVNQGQITVALNSAAPAAALLRNLDYMAGTDNFTVETASAGLGNYTLASGAADYDGSVTVTNDGMELCDLSVGESKEIDGTSYTLVRDDDVLKLAVESVVEKTTRGDFGGTKGVSDILFQNLTDAANPLGAWLDADKWQWDGTLGPAAKSDWTVYGAFDFTGDGVCDIMFRSKLASTQYAVGYYDMGNGREFKTMGWGVTAEWELANVGDFNGNGKSDILWKNTNNGYLGLWMDGTNQWVALPASALGTGQSIIGMGDVNNDGCDDILINSNGVLGAWDITGILEGTEGTPIWSSFGITVSSDWETIGCADFDGNGKADIVLWNDNGYIGTYMNCDGSDFRAIYPSAAKDEWGIPGFGDYDGDGTEDVLVRNLASGALGYWDGNDNFTWHEIGSGVDSTWAVIA